MSGQNEILRVNDNATVKELGVMVERLMSEDNGRYFKPSNTKAKTSKEDAVHR